MPELIEDLVENMRDLIQSPVPQHADIITGYLQALKRATAEADHPYAALHYVEKNFARYCDAVATYDTREIEESRKLALDAVDDLKRALAGAKVVPDAVPLLVV